MESFFKSWLKYAREHQEAESSISSLASIYGMGRRKDFRICYPSWGDLGYLPQVFVRGELANTYDIGMGGLGLVPRNSESSGGNFEIELKWPNHLTFQIGVKAIASYKHRTHLQFQEMSPQIKRKLKSCLLPRLVGQRFQLVRLKNSPFQCVEDEAWVSLQSETLLIQDGFSIFRMGRDEIHIENRNGIYLKTARKRQFIEDRDQIAELLICLSNFTNPSRHLNDLRDYVYDYWRGVSNA